MRNDIIYYSVGALMYCPANSTNIIGNLLENKFGNKFSLAFCLEDTINDDMVEEAEEQLIKNLKTLYKLREEHFYLPKIFIRVRNKNQIEKVLNGIGNAHNIITGFNIPKFNIENAEGYIKAVKDMSEKLNHKFWLMPILESDDLIDLRTRYVYLHTIKDILDKNEDIVLNVRVGGNDLSHAFGLRRHSNETVYDIKPVASVLVDILTVFSRNYVVSGAVWEYYNGENWAEGLADEIKMDMLSGFVGKTAIHPKQISIINENCKVLKEDYDDAKSILGWDKLNPSFVSGSTNKSRMNEYKTHYNWAEKIMYLAKYYGVR